MDFFGFKLPSISIPSIPKISVPKISIPKVSIPKISIPKISVPKISVPKISLPSVSLPKVSLPSVPNSVSKSISTAQKAVSDLNLAAKGILPTGLKVGTKAYNRWVTETTKRARWAAEEANEAAEAAKSAAGSVSSAVSKVSLPKVALPNVAGAASGAISTISNAGGSVANAAVHGSSNLASLAKINLPGLSGFRDLGSSIANAAAHGSTTLTSLAKISIPGMGAVSSLGGSVANAAVHGSSALTSLSKTTLPDLSKITLPTLPGVNLSEAAGTIGGLAASASAPGVLGNALSNVSLPSGAGNAAGAASGAIDTIVDARDQSYENAAARLANGDTALGVAQFGATAAADVMLPMDAANVGNKLLTGRGDELTAEDYLWAGIDVIGLAAAPFTFGASYAATRGLKALKTGAKIGKGLSVGADAAKVASVGASAMSIGKGLKSLRGLAAAGKSASSLSALKAAQAAKAAAAARAAKHAAYLKQMKNLNAAKAASAVKAAANAAKVKAAKYAESLKAAKEAQAAKEAASLKAMREAQAAKQTEEMASMSKRLDAIEGVKTTETAKSSKIGSALKYTALGAGLGTIGLTALGLGGVIGGGGSTDPSVDDSYYPMGDTDIPDFTGAGDDGFDWSSLLGGGTGTTIDPTTGLPIDGGDGYYDPAYPDPFGLEDGAQDILSGLDGVPVVGDIADAARANGVALPVLLIGAVIVIGGTAYFLKKTKTGKKITSKIGGAVKGAGKAVKGAA